MDHPSDLISQDHPSTTIQETGRASAPLSCLLLLYIFVILILVTSVARRTPTAHLDIPPSLWHHVVYTDESRINLWGSDGEQWCCRGPREANLPRNLKTTKQQGGGGLMVWGCITSEGVGWLYCVEGSMNASQYCTTLSATLFPSLEDAGMDASTIFFQQDNA
jgi:hypothetical protein